VAEVNLWLTIPLSALVGAASWSFAEYAMHGWNGHHLKGRTDFSREHLAHHADPPYFAPAWKKARAALGVMAIMAPLAMWLVGALVGVVYTLCFVASYLFYEHVHLRAHTHPPRNRYGRWLRKHHFTHHFNNPKHNHGVTSALWDKVFGTFREIDVVRVPAGKAMVWLCDEQTGEVHAEYADDYRLTRAHSGARTL
jgi:sterol desaturase/sphingolipid hydroxylase (fatty acid hydroxylase superfamily)